MVMVSGCTTTASRDAAFHEDSALSQVNTDNTLNLVTRLEEADRALREARLNDAEVMYRELIKSHPQVPEVYLRLGNIYTRQAQLEAAQQTYKEGLRYRPKDARLWNNLALVQLKQATRTLEASNVVLEPDDPYRPRLKRFHEALLLTGVSPLKQVQEASQAKALQEEVSNAKVSGTGSPITPAAKTTVQFEINPSEASFEAISASLSATQPQSKTQKIVKTTINSSSTGNEADDPILKEVPAPLVYSNPKPAKLEKLIEESTTTKVKKNKLTTSARKPERIKAEKAIAGLLEDFPRPKIPKVIENNGQVLPAPIRNSIVTSSPSAATSGVAVVPNAAPLTTSSEPVHQASSVFVPPDNVEQ